MTLEARLFELEDRLVEQREFDDLGAWTRSVWPDLAAEVHGMRVHRATRKVDQDLLMVHRFEKTPGTANLHEHPYAMASHVLGPGTYELGLGTTRECQARVLCAGSFYYEMLARQQAHYVLPLDDRPVYTVAMWTPYRPMEAAPTPLTVIVSEDWLSMVQEKVQEVLDGTC